MKQNQFAQRLKKIKAKYECQRSHTENDYYDDIEFKIQKPSLYERKQASLFNDRSTRAKLLQNVQQNFGLPNRQFSSASKINNKPSVNHFEQQLRRKILQPKENTLNILSSISNKKCQHCQTKPIKQYDRSTGIHNLKRYYENFYNQYTYQPTNHNYQPLARKNRNFFTDKFAQAVQAYPKTNIKTEKNYKIQTLRFNPSKQVNNEEFNCKLKRSSSCRLTKNQRNHTYNFDAFDQIQAKISKYLKGS